MPPTNFDHRGPRHHSWWRVPCLATLVILQLCAGPGLGDEASDAATIAVREAFLKGVKYRDVAKAQAVSLPSSALGALIKPEPNDAPRMRAKIWLFAFHPASHLEKGDLLAKTLAQASGPVDLGLLVVFARSDLLAASKSLRTQIVALLDNHDFVGDYATYGRCEASIEAYNRLLMFLLDQGTIGAPPANPWAEGMAPGTIEPVRNERIGKLKQVIASLPGFTEVSTSPSLKNPSPPSPSSGMQPSVANDVSTTAKAKIAFSDLSWLAAALALALVLLAVLLWWRAGRATK